MPDCEIVDSSDEGEKEKAQNRTPAFLACLQRNRMQELREVVSKKKAILERLQILKSRQLACFLRSTDLCCS